MFYACINIPYKLHVARRQQFSFYKIILEKCLSALSIQIYLINVFMNYDQGLVLVELGVE